MDDNLVGNDDKIERIIAGQFMDSFYPAYDGVTVCMDNYAKHLQKKDGAFVVAPRLKGYDDSNLSYDVFRLRGLMIPGLQYKLIIKTLNCCTVGKIAKRDIDICHTHSPFAAGQIGLKIARKKKIPIVSTFHTQFKSDFLKYTKSEKLANFMVGRVVSYYNKVDEVWAVNERCGEVLREYGYKGRLDIVTNGTDLEYPIDADELIAETAARHNLNLDNPVFVFTGRLTLQKNLKLTLDALKLYRESGNEFKFIIVGYGEDEGAIKKIVAENNLNDYVIFTGKITDRRVLSGYYLVSDLFLFPSIYDNDALVRKEAAACYTPSVVVDGSNTALGTEHGVNGYLIENDAADMCRAIVEAMRDRKHNKTVVGVNAANTLAVPWKVVVDGVYERYAELIKRFNAAKAAGKGK